MRASPGGGDAHIQSMPSHNRDLTGHCAIARAPSLFSGEISIASFMQSGPSQYLFSAILATGSILSVLVVLAALVGVWWKRRRTYRRLVQAGLPTVYWRPKFVRYHVDEDKNQKLAASSITNILPRMRRLQGPFGMYGTVYGVSTAVVHVAHPVAALAILQNNSTTTTTTTSCKAPAYDHFKNFCGEGVFTAEGDDWRCKRAAVLHALTRGASGSLFDRVQGEAEGAVETLVLELDRRIKHRQQPSDLGESLCRIPNIVPLLQRATIGLIYRFLTHRDLSTLENKDDESRTVATMTESDDDDSLEGKDSFPETIQASGTGAKSLPSLLTSYLTSITRIRMILLAQSRSIWFLLPRWCYTQFASLYRAEEETMGPIRQVAAEAIVRAAPLSPLQQLQQLPLYSESNGKCSKNLMDEAITLLFAGQDTSAATLSWTLHLLTVHPYVQAKLAEEVCREISADCTLTKNVLARLPYLDAVLKESMRLYPVAPFVVRQVGKNLHIRGSAVDQNEISTVTLPEGSLACIWIYSLHRNPDFWERPDDFWPERWLRDDNRVTPGSYMPFAAGARNCVGQPLANVILRTLLARLIHRYEFRDERVVASATDKALLDNRNDEGKVPGTGDPNIRFRKAMQAGFTVLPQDGLPLLVQLREHQKAAKEPNL